MVHIRSGQVSLLLCSGIQAGTLYATTPATNVGRCVDGGQWHAQSMAWFVVSTCSAAADMMQFPVVRAFLSSLTRCMRELLVWPVYCR